MKILHQLDRPEFRPSKSDKLLIHFVREHAPEFCTSPIAVLAVRCGVSEATITRFVRKMGFNSLQFFKLSLAEELAEKKRRSIISSNIACDEEVHITAGKLLANNIAALEHTVSNLDEQVIDASAELIKNADRVFFMGMGNSGFVANDSAYKFMRIGINARGLDNSHLIMLNMALVHEGSLVVALTHSGESYEIIEAMDLARRNGAKLIVITANKDCLFKERSDVCIFYENGEPILKGGTVPTKLTQIFIVDLIYTEVVKRTMDTASNFRQKTAEAINTVRMNIGG